MFSKVPGHATQVSQRSPSSPLCLWCSLEQMPVCPGRKCQQGCTCMTFESSSLLVLPSLGCSLDSSGRFLDAFRTPLYHLGSVALEHPLKTWKSNCHSQSFHGLQGTKGRPGSILFERWWPVSIFYEDRIKRNGLPMQYLNWFHLRVRSIFR